MERPDAAADVIAREDGGEAEGRLHQLHRQLEKVLLAQEHLRQGKGGGVAAARGRTGRAARARLPLGTRDALPPQRVGVVRDRDELDQLLEHAARRTVVEPKLAAAALRRVELRDQLAQRRLAALGVDEIAEGVRLSRGRGAVR